jgi:hypothetical protein
MNINLEKLEAQISLNNKRFKVISSQQNDFNNKRQSLASLKGGVQRKPDMRATPLPGGV